MTYPFFKEFNVTEDRANELVETLVIAEGAFACDVRSTRRALVVDISKTRLNAWCTEPVTEEHNDCVR